MRLPDLGIGTPEPTGGPLLLGAVLASGLADPAVCEAIGRVLVVSSRFGAWATGDGLAAAAELSAISGETDAGWSRVRAVFQDLRGRQEASAAQRRAITTAVGMTVAERIAAYRAADQESGLAEGRAALAAELHTLADGYDRLPYREQWDRP